MGLLSKYIKSTSLNPLDRLIQNGLSVAEGKLENAVEDAFTKGLKKAGLSSSTSQLLASRFTDSLKHNLADKYFGTTTSQIDRVSRQKIIDGVAPRYAETAISSLANLDNNIKKSDQESSYQFPSQIGKYYINLKFREYTRTAPQAEARAVFKNQIILPIPENLAEKFNIVISESNQGVMGGIADAIQAWNSEGSTFTPTSSMGALAYNALATKEASNIPLIGDAIDIARAPLKNDTFQQFIGAIPNPHVAAIFQGVGLRSYTLEWTFAPRNKDESSDLMDIINILRQNSLPSFSSAGTAALQYPFLCYPELYPWAEEKGAELMQFKPAMLREVNVDYSPGGIPSFFASSPSDKRKNLPTIIKISLSFMETEYFTAGDYGRLPGDDGVERMVENGKQAVDAVIPGASTNMTKFLNDSIQKAGGNS